MLKAVDIRRELAGLEKLEGRNAHTTEAETDAAFATLADFRDGGIFAGSFSGDSGWERHTKGDEIVHILDGETCFDIITGDGRQTMTLRAGELLVVPVGCWHRFRSETGVTVLTATPQPTEHTYADDPRASEQG